MLPTSHRLPRLALLASGTTLSGLLVFQNRLPVHLSLVAIGACALAWLLLDARLTVRAYIVDRSVVERGELRTRETAQAKRFSDADTTFSSLESGWDNLASLHQQKIKSLVQERQELPGREEQARQEAITHLERTLTSVELQRARVAFDEEVTLQRVWVQYSKDYVPNYIKSQRVENSWIEGIGYEMKRRLIHHEIVTAHDVQRARIEGIYGFGGQRVNLVMAWRAEVEQEARNSIPRRLPDAQRDEIRGRFNADRRALDAEELAARKRHRQLPRELKDIRQKFAARPAEIPRELEAEDEEYRLRRQDLSSALETARTRLEAERSSLEAVRNRLAWYEDLSVPRFVLVVIGRPGRWQRPALALREEAAKCCGHCDELIYEVGALIESDRVPADAPANRQYGLLLDQHEAAVKSLESASSLGNLLAARDHFVEGSLALETLRAAIVARVPYECPRPAIAPAPDVDASLNAAAATEQSADAHNRPSGFQGPVLKKWGDGSYHLELYEDGVRIIRRRKQPVDIPLSTITAVQFDQARAFKMGFVNFVVAGQAPIKDSLAAGKTPTALAFFFKSNSRKVKAITDTIEARLESSAMGGPYGKCMET